MDGESLDLLITDAFGKAKADLRDFCSPLGPLFNLSSLFPSHSAPSLRMLAQIVLPTRSAKPPPYLKVALGVGDEFAKANDIYSFFNGMLEFESEDAFAGFVQHGYTLVILGGNHNDIVAAASFIVASDGLFVDAIAVSHGTHKDSCKMSPQMVKAVCKDDTQIKLLSNASGANFQRFGLGSLFIELLSRCASLLCSSSNAAVYLKANTGSQPYYLDRGFERATRMGDVLHKIVPASHREVSNETSLMVRLLDPSIARSFTSTQEADAAQAIAGLISTPLDEANAKNSDGANEEPSATPANPKPSAKSHTTPQAIVNEADAANINEEDAAPPNSRAKLSKKDKERERKRKRKRLAVQQADAVTVASSDEENATGDYSTYQPSVGPGPNWELPRHNYWEPQASAYAMFKAQQPVVSHQLSQKEVSAKHGNLHPKALGRLAVLRMARTFQEDTQFMQSTTSAAKKRYDRPFLDQDYLDFAAVADLNRPLQVHHDKYQKATRQVRVQVSSYTLPANMTLVRLLDDERSRNSLKPALRIIEVSVPWLLGTTRREVAEWIEETLHGTKVQRIGGSNIGTDAISLSFSGKGERDMQFVPLPQGHVATTFAPLAPDSIPWSRPKATSKPGKNAMGPGVYYDVNGHATQVLHKRMKDEAKALNVTFVPPPPHEQTQVVKLKWVPAQGTGHDPMKDGLWHGVYAVSLGAAKSTTVLVECGLLTDWVEGVFAAPFRNECKLIAGGKQGKRNPRKFLFIPAGDIHDTEADPPPTTELLPHATTAYLQGNNDTCLRDSLASALATMGFALEAKIVAADASLVGSTLELVQKVAAVVQKIFAKSNLVMKKLHNHACAVGDIATLDASWPIILILQTNDGCHGSHAVTTWNKMLFDSNCRHPLRWSQKSLDWCSGKDSACVGFSRAYRICPANCGETLSQSATKVGVLVRLHGDGDDANNLGWIRCLPSKKRSGYQVRYTNGETKFMNEEGVARFIVPWSDVGGL